MGRDRWRTIPNEHSKLLERKSPILKRVEFPFRRLAGIPAESNMVGRLPIGDLTLEGVEPRRRLLVRRRIRKQQKIASVPVGVGRRTGDDIVVAFEKFDFCPDDHQVGPVAEIANGLDFQNGPIKD